MVLKVRGIPERGWVFHDGITRIRATGGEWKEKEAQIKDGPTVYEYNSYNQIVVPESVEIDFDHSVFQAPGEARKTDELRHGYCQMAICTIHGDEKLIAFTEGYLLGDDGKTIERL